MKKINVANLVAIMDLYFENRRHPIAYPISEPVSIEYVCEECYGFCVFTVHLEMIFAF